MPWTFAVLAAFALTIQLIPSLQTVLVYDRIAVAHGEIWRIWTGHLVHFGWHHMLIDTGLFLVMGWLLERSSPAQSYTALIAMPIAIAVTLYYGDYEMIRYGGLSGINFGLLVYVALQGWQKNWVDWFWPVVICIYVAELYLESSLGHGHGGGAIKFSDPSIHVATWAHVGGGLFGVGLWLPKLIKRTRPTIS